MISLGLVSSLAYRSLDCMLQVAGVRVAEIKKMTSDMSVDQLNKT